MMNSELLLEEIKTLWHSSREHMRNAKLKMGSLLQQYIMEGLKEADAMNEMARLEQQISRVWLMRKAAKTLDVKECTIYELTRISAVVDLLSDQGNIGDLSYHAIRTFRMLVHHPLGRVRRSYDSTGVSSTEKACWVIREPVEKSIAMFRKAVEGNYSAAEVYSMLPIKNTPGKTTKKASHAKEEHMNPLLCAREGTPRDLVDMILQMIEFSNDKETTIALLNRELNKPQRLTIS